jgi:ABC-type nitrate/sulfonate/bicarbonate transport system ATPase subunit
MTDNQNSEIIKFDKVTKIFNDGQDNSVCALRNVDFTIKKEEIVSFVGPSGCGKTTVLRILSGLETQTTGDVKIKGQKVKIGMCGMVFQSYSSFPWLTVLDNVAFGLKLQKEDKKSRHDEARKYINLVGLEGFENRFPNELSGGQKQRVAIARTLAVKNDILLMDEPFGALDIKIRSEMQELLLNIWRKLKPTIILVTHDIQEAIYLPNRIFVFSRPFDLDPNNPDKSQLEVKNIDKNIEDRAPEWKNSHEFEYYEKQIKELQFE